MSATVQELLRLLASPAGLLAMASELHIGAGEALPFPPNAADATERQWLVRDGLGGLANVVVPANCRSLTRGIEGLRAHGLPAAFVYAFDEPWALGELVRARLSAVVGHAYALVEDVWAWHVAPGAGGWPPHRGITPERLDRDAPEILNVWVALSDATAERACMHAIPLDEDPSYPHALDQLDAPLTAVRALPATAGDALFWNANVLHWGGRCAARAPGPRVSCSFTLCRADAASRFPELALVPAGIPGLLDLGRRGDLLAEMVLVYGKDQPDVSDVVREWAAITHGLAMRFPRT